VPDLWTSAPALRRAETKTKQVLLRKIGGALAVLQAHSSPSCLDAVFADKKKYLEPARREFLNLPTFVDKAVFRSSSCEIVPISNVTPVPPTPSRNANHERGAWHASSRYLFVSECQLDMAADNFKEGGTTYAFEPKRRRVHSRSPPPCRRVSL
jgi:hypothetical protein